MEYENLFKDMDNIMKSEVDKDIERYKKDGSIPMFSRLGGIKRIYIKYGKKQNLDGEKLFNDDLSAYINQEVNA